MDRHNRHSTLNGPPHPSGACEHPDATTPIDQLNVPNSPSFPTVNINRPQQLAPTRARPSLERMNSHHRLSTAGPVPSKPAEMGENMIRINVLAPYIEQGPSRPSGWPIHRSTKIAQLKDALCRGEYGGRPCKRDKMKIIFKGRLLDESDVLGDVVGPTREPDMVHSFILIAESPHHIYTPTPLDNDVSSSYFGRPRSRSPFRSRPGTPLIITQPSTPRLEVPSTAHPTSSETLSRGSNPGMHPDVDPSATPQQRFGSSSTMPNSHIDIHPNSTGSEASYESTIRAVADSTHFLLFLARHHLFRFLERPALAWADMYPAPTVPFDQARDAVKEVVGDIMIAAGHATTNDGDWESSFGALEYHIGPGSDVGETGGQVSEDRIKALWQGCTGKEWRDDEQNSAAVEVDFDTFDLHVPPLSHLSPSQRYHLCTYLQITSTLPILSALLSRILAAPPSPSSSHLLASQPTPTRTTPTPHPIPPEPHLRPVRHQFSIRVSLPLLQHAFTSLVQIGAMIWMLTPRMAWSDTRFWIICFAAMGWWVGDLRRVQVGLARRRRRAEEEAEARARALRGGDAGPERQVGAEPVANGEALPDQDAGAVQGQDGLRRRNVHQQPNVAPGTPDQPPRPRAAARNQNPAAHRRQMWRMDDDTTNYFLSTMFRLVTTSLYMWYYVLNPSALATVHLQTDARQLRLPPFNVNGNRDTGGDVVEGQGGNDNDRRAARQGDEVANPQQRPQHSNTRRPSRLVTQFILPVCLYFMTLVPFLETIRAASIRKRERAMRVIVGELNPPPPASQQQSSGGGNHDEQAAARDGGNGQEPAGVEEPEQRTEQILPAGLDDVGIRYYRRVLEKGEGIDWEEEREAQRAAEAEFGGGDAGGAGGGWN